MILVLTTTLGFVVCRYCIRYLDGMEGQARFLAYTLLNLGAVLWLLSSRNLVLFLLSWFAVSAGLHRLLTWFPQRPAAIRAARKKFIISRIGDVCLLVSVLLAYRLHGTLEFPELFTPGPIGNSSWEAAAMAVLLVLGAMTKSAQFPFHTWLPETMEAPTPVSALMHAGIINAGGYLIVRLSPLVAQAPLALDLLLFNGALTALIGSLVMLTQTDVKRSLAYSTVSQMGFMFMQCGLGAFSAAVLHMIAHGLYKAHAFLGTGAAATWASKKTDLPVLPAILTGCAALAGSAGLLALGLALFDVHLSTKPGGVVIATFLTAGVSVLLFRVWGDRTLRALQRAVLTAGALLMVLLYLATWKGVDTTLRLFLDLSRAGDTPSSFARSFSLVVVITTIGALFLGWVGRPLGRSRLGRRLYFLALNGFHVADILRLPFARRHPKLTLLSQRAV
jgi:NAD(P)H-quinone oxidoreductase subunit 5